MQADLRIPILWILILVNRFLLRGDVEGRGEGAGRSIRNPIRSVHRWQAHLLDEGAIARVGMDKVESGVRLNQEE
jgi:hypothetical protein